MQIDVHTIKQVETVETLLSWEVNEAFNPVSVVITAEIKDLHLGICFVQESGQDFNQEANKPEGDLKEFPFGEAEYDSNTLCCTKQSRVVPTIDLGRNVPLGETIEVKLCIKNYGGIICPIDVEVEEFGADEHSAAAVITSTLYLLLCQGSFEHSCLLYCVEYQAPHILLWCRFKASICQFSWNSMVSKGKHKWSDTF